MSKSKDMKIKRLRRGRIWPSVILLLTYIVLSAIGAIVSVGAIVYAISDAKVNGAFGTAEQVSSLIASAPEGVSEKDILSQLENTGSYESVYILDRLGTVKDGFGDMTCDIGKICRLSLDDAYKTYADENTFHYLVDNQGKLNNDVIKKLFYDVLNVRGALGSIHDMKDTVAYSESFWTVLPIEGTENELIVKSTVSLTRYDLFLSFICSVSAIFIVALPILFLYSNVVSSIHSQRQLTDLLYTDTATGGHNWMYFEHFADKALRKGIKTGKLYAVVDISWIKFRNFCAYHGAKEGETYLETVDRILTGKLKRGESCAHYGKASYALLLKCDSKEECIKRVTDIVNGLPKAIGHDSTVFHAGIYFSEQMPQDAKALFRHNGVNPAELYSFAGSARAAITEENHCEVAVFDKKLLEDQIWEHKVSENMQKALDNEEFKVYIQPKYDPVTEKLAGAEALVRWINEEDGFISPGKFIPIFEKNGFITKLDDYMISHVAALQAKWLSEGKEIVPISVNVSRAHFADTDLAGHIASLVDKYKVPHHFIEIELTESAFFDDKSMLLSTVKQLKDMGFDISMDDFGAGYSSLNSLKDLPLDVLKLDAEFFRGENSGERGEIVVSEAIELAKKLNMRTVAEGVEKKDQVEFLAQNGCDMIQGFYYSKPVPAEDYEKKLG